MTPPAPCDTAETGTGAVVRHPRSWFKVSLALLGGVAVFILVAIYQEAQNDFRIIPLGTLGRSITIANGMTDLGKLPKNADVVSMNFSGRILCNIWHPAPWWARAWNYLGEKQLLPEKLRLKDFSETHPKAILLEFKPKARARLDTAPQRHR